MKKITNTPSFTPKNPLAIARRLPVNALGTVDDAFIQGYCAVKYVYPANVVQLVNRLGRNSKKVLL